MKMDMQLMADACIASPHVAIVSFDFFDTLFFRPGFQPSDLFHLLNQSAAELLNLDNFASIRGSAEAEIAEVRGRDGIYRNFHTLEDIYRHIARRCNLDDEKCLALCKLELDLERRALRPRMDVRRLYERAVECGKRVIVVSDAYFPASFLRSVLADNGFNNIAEVYVSNACAARKDTGDLFAHVLEKEGVSAHRMAHIGDNLHSDVEMALAAGVVAIHYPSILEQLTRRPDGPWARALADRNNLDPAARLLMGLAISDWFSRNRASGGDALFEDNLGLFGFVGLGPVLFHTAHEIAMSHDIQGRYPSVCFASRDGYLPRCAYDILSEGTQNVPSRYIYCGRAAYDSHRYNGDPAFFLSEETFRANGYTLQSLLTYVFSAKNADLHAKLVDAFAQEELDAPYQDCREAFARVCALYETELKTFLARERELASRYYSTAIAANDAGRAIIFDVGYSGSVSRAIGALTGLVVDKIYMSESDTNRELDHEHGTVTYQLIRSPDELTRDVEGIFLVFEELFSPAEPACIGFSDTGEVRPVFDAGEIFSSQMRDDLAAIQEAALSFVRLAKDTFGPFLQNLRVCSAQHLLRPTQFAFGRSLECEDRMFRNILFADRFFHNISRPLSMKVQPYQDYGNLPARSGFTEPSRLLFPRPAAVTGDMRIGVHIYLPDAKFLQTVLIAAAQIPVPFDLFLSAGQADLLAPAEEMLRAMSPAQLGEATFRTYPDGGSISPWITLATTEMKDYDLVCHLGAVSPDGYSAMTGGWLEHLLREMFAPGAVAGIVCSFRDDQSLGVAFPAIYQEAFDTMRLAPGGIVPKATRVEMDRILRDLKIQTGFNRSDFFFPVGDAFWCRPSAVRPLLDWASAQGGLTRDVTNAIARTLVVVSSASGARAKAFASEAALSRVFCAEVTGSNNRSADLAHVRLELEQAQHEVNRMANSRELRIARAGVSLYVRVFPDNTRRRKCAGTMLRLGMAVVRKTRGALVTPKKELARHVAHRLHAATADRISNLRVRAQIARMNRFNAEKPAFSVVIPIYNRTWQLELAIDSILKQDFRNFELLLVCDGSPQETLEIVDRYEGHPQVRTHKYPDNSGNACRGRNTGIQMARGTYVAFMDSDDISTPNRLFTSLFHFIKQHADVVYGSVTIISDGVRQIEGIWDGQFRKSFGLSVQEMEAVNPAWTSTVAVRREILQRYGGFRAAMRYREDQELWLRLAYNGCKLYPAEEMLAYYRFHAQNAELLFKNNDDHWKRLMQELYKTPYEG